MKRIRIFLVSIALALSFGGLVPVVAHAETAKQSVCSSLGSKSDCSTTPNGGVSVNNVITVIVNTLSFIVGVASVIMIIVGGFKMVTSGGDSNKVASGRQTVVYSIIGLIVVVFAQAIVYFVLNKLK